MLLINRKCQKEQKYPKKEHESIYLTTQRKSMLTVKNILIFFCTLFSREMRSQYSYSTIAFEKTYLMVLLKDT